MRVSVRLMNPMVQCVMNALVQGRVEFDKNYDRESAYVQIEQLQDDSEVIVGVYDPQATGSSKIMDWNHRVMWQSRWRASHITLRDPVWQSR